MDSSVAIPPSAGGVNLESTLSETPAPNAGTPENLTQTVANAPVEPTPSPAVSPDIAELSSEETADVMDDVRGAAETHTGESPSEWPVTPVGLPIREGDWVILQMMDGKKLSVRAGQGSRGTHFGELDLKPLVGKSYGTAARTRTGFPVYLLRPSLQDHIMTLKRITQIIYPKDIGTILLKLGIGAGSRVLECGTGSGALTMALAWMVGPTGHIYSYEREKAHHERAHYNLTRVNLIDRVTLYHRDMLGRDFDQKGIEAGFLDVRDPAELLPQMTEALAPGAVLGFLVPTTNQVSDVLRLLENAPYIDTEVMEIFVRKFKVNANRLRPDDRMVAHTGFLIFTRRIEPVADFVPPEPRKPKAKGTPSPVEPEAEEADDSDAVEGGLGEL